MKLDLKLTLGFLLALPASFIAAKIVKAILSAGGDVIQSTAKQTAEATEGTTGHTTVVAIGWIPWGDLLPFIPTVLAVIGAIAWAKSRYV